MNDFNQFTRRMELLLGVEESRRFFDAIKKLSNSDIKSLRINPASRLSADDLGREGFALEKQVPWCENGWFFDRSSSPDLSSHPYVISGALFVQEAGAMEPVRLLDPKPSEIVLDLCAAPGAKSTQIIECLQGKGWLVSNDPNRERARTLDSLLSRHGAVNSTVYNLEPHVLEKAFSGVFDAILVDAPCSGESLFAKRGDHRVDVKDSEIERCSVRQAAILKSASQMLKSSGRVLYSTCAYSREENEDVVSHFLSENPDFKLKHESRRYPHIDGVPGGYSALLSREGVSSSEGTQRGADESLHTINQAIRNQGVNGLIRNGKVRWDGVDDDYLCYMDRSDQSPYPVVDVTQAELKSILSESFTTTLSDRVRSVSPQKNSLVGVRCLGQKVCLLRVETNRIRSLLPIAIRY